MANRAGIRDVAVHAGVSVGTVSNALNRPELLARETLDRIRESIAELGFVRNESARQLRTGRGRAIGLVVLDVANPFFTDVARAVEDVANDSALPVILCNSDGRSDKEDRYLGLLAEQQVQGVLLSPVDAPKSDALTALRARGIPVVLLDHRASSNQLCSASVDDRLGGELAIEHLLDRGHERVAYVCGPQSIRQVRDRLTGALDAWRASGRDAEDLTVIEVPGLAVDSGRIAGERLSGLPRRRRPTAAFCANDLLALGLLQRMTQGGVAVPGELAIVGYDDIEFAGAAAVPLTSVRQPRAELGRIAARLLLEEASGARHRHQRVVLLPELIVRDSSLAAPRPRRAASSA